MRYHDNDILLPVSSESGYTLINGSYTVNSFSITSGQDPDGNIHKGLTKHFGSDGEMTFRVGRKSSKDVAYKFTDEVKASQTTFNHDPGDLNFAFFGTLELKITGGILGRNVDVFTFADIAIAQGSAGLSNNWWFGGKNCKYIGNNTVSCMGTSKSGMAVEFKFYRGGNSVNDVLTTPGGVSNWMSNLNDSIELGELMMPASHDAGMSQLHHCNPFIGSEPYTKTQSESIGSQLSSGSRYFDIRVDYDYNELVTYHRTGAHGCNGQNLASVFDEARAFLKENSQEVAIFRISHIRDYGEDHKSDDTKERINSFINEYADIIYTNTNSNVNLQALNLGETRGKLILVFAYSDYIDTATGRFRYMKGNSSSPNANLTVYDSYADTPDYNTMKNDQLEKWNKYGQGKKDFSFLLSWTLTSNNPPFSPTIEHLAEEANSHISSVLNNQIVDKKWSCPNFVYLDFVNSKITQQIIAYHFNGSLPLKNPKDLAVSVE